jgi:hypothetical protein
MNRIGKWIIKITCLIAVVFFSCDKPQDVSLPPYVPKLVVHGYNEAGDIFELFISRTTPKEGIIPEDSTLIVRNATAILYEDGVLKDTFTYSPILRKYYALSDTARPGKIYRIVVQAPGFATVEASSAVPPTVPNTSVVHTKKARLDALQGPLDDITFGFSDPAGQDNYYLLQLHGPEPYYGSNFTCVYTYDPVIEAYQASLSPFDSRNCIGSGEVVFSDKLFDGTQKEITISANSFALQDIRSNGVNYHAYLKKYVISKEFYQYVKDGLLRDALQENPFAQPFTVAGNVKNGYGMFAVVSATVDTLR